MDPVLSHLSRLPCGPWHCWWFETGVGAAIVGDWNHVAAFVWRISGGNSQVAHRQAQVGILNVNRRDVWMPPLASLESPETERSPVQGQSDGTLLQ